MHGVVYCSYIHVRHVNAVITAMTARDWAVESIIYTRAFCILLCFPSTKRLSEKRNQTQQFVCFQTRPNIYSLMSCLSTLLKNAHLYFNKFVLLSQQFSAESPSPTDRSRLIYKANHITRTVCVDIGLPSFNIKYVCLNIQFKRLDILSIIIF